MSKKAIANNSFIYLFSQAIKGGEQDYTSGSMRRAIFMLAVPMILEMSLESVFAVVDIFFVSRLGNYATATVGLTESVITLVYSIAIGLSMAATAIISRRIGEKNPEEASKSAVQVIMITLMVTCAISIAGAVFAKDILLLMGAEEEVAEKGTAYTRIVFSSSIFITYLFVINGIFRGAGDASIAMRSLWIANICNIILCPTLIYGVGPIPAFGLTGAAIATAIGRELVFVTRLIVYLMAEA